MGYLPGLRSLFLLIGAMIAFVYIFFTRKEVLAIAAIAIAIGYFYSVLVAVLVGIIALLVSAMLLKRSF